jgi:hypothetical protein
MEIRGIVFFLFCFRRLCGIKARACSNNEGARMADIQTVSIAIASASVVAGVIYYSLQVRHQNLQIQQQNKMRQTDLVMRLYSTFDSMEFLEAWRKVYFTEYTDYDDFLKKLKGKREVAMKVFRFYEQVGVLLRRKLIDIDLVDDLFGNNAIITWEKTKGSILEELRKTVNPRAYENFEYLYNAMKKKEQKLQQS